MYRSQSQQKIHKISYQNISSRISRLQATSSLKRVMSGTITPHLNQSQQVISGAASRLQLKAQKDGIFGLDISNHIGRVSKNVGIKKYNQRQIKDALNRNPLDQIDQKTNRKSVQRISKQYDSYRYGRVSPVPENTQPQPSKTSMTNSTIKLYNYLPENSSIGGKKFMGSSLVPGRVYSVQELRSLM